MHCNQIVVSFTRLTVVIQFGNTYGSFPCNNLEIVLRVKAAPCSKKKKIKAVTLVEMSDVLVCVVTLSACFHSCND